MKHIPILFSTAMVQAILEGRKTQTRRTKGLEDMADSKFKYKGIPDGLPATHAFARMFNGHWVETIHKFCPYGQPGDVLWVREAFTKVSWPDGTSARKIQTHYKADNDFIGEHKWKPSIHMPKSACRLWLKVECVRAERVQDISNDDAIKEGIFLQDTGYYCHVNDPSLLISASEPREAFKKLWKTIHEGKESDWNNNPLVWVEDFKQIEKPENFA